MISYIQGKIISKSLAGITVLTPGGVGYKIFVKPTEIDKFQIEQEVNFLTYLIVREAIMDLYGFESEEERELFTHFLNVSGIGPKSALHLLSLGSVGEISNAISSGDVDYLTKVSGVGRKTAERIVVELKEKIGSGLASSSTGIRDIGGLGDVIEGLVAVGYTVQQAREAVKTLDADGKSSEELMREALRAIS